MNPANPVMDWPAAHASQPGAETQTRAETQAGTETQTRAETQAGEPTEEDEAQPRFRPPDTRAGDGATLWSLARASGGLDDNSEYAYHMMAEFFSDTCILAEIDGEPVGFITGFRPPSRPDTLFVWQIAVAPEFRGRRLAPRMLIELLDRLESAGVRFLEASVTPSNTASRRTFHGVAHELEAWCEESAMFSADSFTSGAHEDEIRYRIGPFRPCAGGGLPGELGPVESTPLESLQAIAADDAPARTSTDTPQTERAPDA